MKFSHRAFTLVEFCACILIVVILCMLAIPVTSSPSADARQRITGTLSNMRQIHIGLQAMELDNLAEGKTASGPWVYAGRPIPAVAELTNALVSQGYLSAGDMQKLLSSPSSTTFESGLTFYAVADNDPSETIFISTKKLARSRRFAIWSAIW